LVHKCIDNYIDKSWSIFDALGAALGGSKAGTYRARARAEKIDSGWVETVVLSWLSVGSWLAFGWLSTGSRLALSGLEMIEPDWISAGSRLAGRDRTDLDGSISISLWVHLEAH
jgi:hypothetical protein